MEFCRACCRALGQLVLDPEQTPGALAALLRGFARGVLNLQSEKEKNVLREDSMRDAVAALRRCCGGEDRRRRRAEEDVQELCAELSAALVRGLEPVRGSRLRLQAHSLTAVCQYVASSAAVSAQNAAAAGAGEGSQMWAVQPPGDLRNVAWRRSQGGAKVPKEEADHLERSALLQGVEEGEWVRAPSGMCVPRQYLRPVGGQGEVAAAVNAARWAGVRSAAQCFEDMRGDERLWRNVSKHLTSPSPVLTDNQIELCGCWYELHVEVLHAASLVLMLHVAARGGPAAEMPSADDPTVKQVCALHGSLCEFLSMYDQRTLAAVSRQRAARGGTAQPRVDTIGAAAQYAARVTGTWQEAVRGILPPA